MIVPTLCVGMPPVTLRVTVDAERPWIHCHAERGNDLRVTTQGNFGRFDGFFFARILLSGIFLKCITK
ncbi:hypothetical protein EGJ55_02860 [Pseudomonas moraviensis]|nr:hypothetical protein EGJ55_02860 [Pseudomonas moraviensis]